MQVQGLLILADQLGTLLKTFLEPTSNLSYQIKKQELGSQKLGEIEFQKASEIFCEKRRLLKRESLRRPINPPVCLNFLLSTIFVS